MTQWLAMTVDCAECRGGYSELVAVLGIYGSLDDAKAAQEGSHCWQDRDSGGVFDHDSSGGIEIVPLP